MVAPVSQKQKNDQGKMTEVGKTGKIKQAKGKNNHGKNKLSSRLSPCSPLFYTSYILDEDIMVITIRNRDPVSVCDSVVLMIEEMEVKTLLLRKEAKETLKFLKVR